MDRPIRWKTNRQTSGKGRVTPFWGNQGSKMNYANTRHRKQNKIHNIWICKLACATFIKDIRKLTHLMNGLSFVSLNIGRQGIGWLYAFRCMHNSLFFNISTLSESVPCTVLASYPTIFDKQNFHPKHTLSIRVGATYYFCKWNTYLL